MVIFDIPDPMPLEFMLKIPLQRKVIDELIEEGTIQSYSVSLDRKKLWCTVAAYNQDEVKEVLQTFPLIDFMTYRIEALLFSQASAPTVPSFSLN